MNSRTALVVGDLQERTALSAVRALAAHGWQVHLAGPWTGALAARSRLVAGVHQVPPVASDPGAFVGEVARVLNRVPAVVLPAGDAELAALAAGRAELPPVAGVPLPEVVDRLLDKQQLAVAAEAAGFGAPVVVGDHPQRWPVLLKSVRHFEPGRSSVRWDVRVAHDLDALRAAQAAARAAGVEVVVQERLEGQLVSLALVLDVEGRVLGRSQHRTTSTWPGAAGAAATAVTEPVDEQAAASAAELLRSAGWSGLAELEMIVPAAGPPVLIDVNPRLYGSLALAVAAGVPLPHLAAQVLSGARVDPAGDARPGVRYQWTQGELLRVWSAQGRARAVLGVLRATRGAIDPVWDRSDPRPALWLARRTPLWTVRRAVRR